MHDPAEHALVVKAVCDGLGGCFEWDDWSARIVLDNPDMQGHTPRSIRQRVIELARATGGSCVEQVKEERERWRGEFAYYYKVILPTPGMKYGMFVEIRYSGDEDDDPDFPEATLVGAHPQRRGY
jgi:hypothetical protein